ncbi:MAG TPA: ATP-binding protein [Verrucomicrobiae bacterium]|nr:ATP-binding protein [Verrucomicrobiae bacterium]
MTILWPMVTATCLTLALVHLRIGLGECRRAPHLFFALAAGAVAAISVLELIVLSTSDLHTCDETLRWAAVPIAIMVASVVGFVWTFFGTGRKWLGATAVVATCLAQLANLVSPVPVVRHVVALHRIQTYDGAWFTVPTIVGGPWTIVEIIGVALAVLFVLDASVRLWRRGERRRAGIVGGGIILFFCVSRGQAYLVETGILQMPYLTSFSFLGVIVAMGLELSTDVLRAATLARELRESERRAELAARAAALGFWTWDVTRDEIWVTANARAIFGVSDGEKLDLPRFLDRVHSEDRNTVRQVIEKALAGTGDYHAEYRVQVPDGRIRWIAAHGRAEFDADHTPTLMSGAVVDITERRRSELELQQLRGQLAHAGRVSVMGQLAAAMAHELNQPLGAILSNAEAAELFLDKTPPAFDELRAILDDIRKDDERAGEVIRRMRALMRRQEMEHQDLSINPLVEDVFRLIGADAALRRVTVILSLSPEMPPVNGDRIHLQQVLLNLILNAMEAIGKLPNGRRQITVQTRRLNEREVDISVADSGPGIDPAILPRLFEPFFTTRQNGMGMSLAICQRIVEAHSGQIRAENQPAGGAAFHVTLPAVSEKEAT